MAISIMNNITALSAMRSNSEVGENLANSIQHLSSGLRINASYDDASGFAVAEKLGGQIKGLAKAITNAQDGISMLQTAEAAMGSITDIVQRMRELSVQAGDPTYTANDRLMLQSELDQLKDEVNRVSHATEFNTKKLLNGDAAALWSSTSNDISAIIKGEAAEGNYKISFAAKNGTNAVYKSDVMSIKDGALSYDIKENGTAIKKISNIIGMKSEDNISLAITPVSADVSATSKVIGSTGNIDTVGVAQSTESSEQADNSYVMEIEIMQDRAAGSVASAKFRVQNSVSGELSDWVSANISESGVMTALNAEDLKNLAGLGENEIFKNSSGVTIGAETANDTSRDIELKKGDKILVSVTTKIAANSAISTIQVGNRAPIVQYNTTGADGLTSTDYEKTTTFYTAQIDKAGNVYYGSFDATFSKEPADYKAVMQTGTVVYSSGKSLSSGTTLEADVDIRIASTTKTVYAQGEAIAAGTVTKAQVYIDHPSGVKTYAAGQHVNPGDVGISFNVSAYITIDGSAAPEWIPAGDTIYDPFTVKNAISDPYAAYQRRYGKGATVALAGTVNRDVVEDVPAYTIHKAAGQALSADITLTADVTMTSGSIMKLDILGSGSVASRWTELSSISRFQNSDGRSALDNTQELKVFNSKGEEYSLALESGDTIGSFEEKLKNTLISLGLGADKNSKNAYNVNDNLVNFVYRGGAMAKSNESVEGTFVIQAARTGKSSEIRFSGDSAVINALSLTQIKNAEDAAISVNVKDAHTGIVIGEDTITDNRLRNVIKNVDVVINSEKSSDINYNTASRTMTFSALAEPKTSYLHIVNNATKAATGTNEWQIEYLSIAQMDTASLEIDDVNITTLENAQNSISKLDKALSAISKSRAILGAQMNRLDYTINNVNTMKENLTASKSRISDLDIAQASADFTSRQILMQSATAMLAQADRQVPYNAAQLLR